MNWIKQIVIILVLVLVCTIGWLRLDSGAASILVSLGVPQPVLAMIIGSDPESEGGGTARANFRPPDASMGALVVVSEVGTAAINDRIMAIGDGEALRSVTVVPLSSGILREVNMSAGQHVSAGDVLAVLDSDVELIARDQAALAVKLIEDKVNRYERLLASRATSAVQLTEAHNELQNARLSLREAELTLERRSIVAPIDGVVGIVPVELGDYVTQQTEIATIDDRGSLLVDFYVPERFAAMVRENQPIEADSIAVPGRVFKGRIHAVASRVERASRTLQLRGIVENKQDYLRPGMSFRVRMSFEGEPYPAVDPLAIQWSSGGPYLWKVVDGKSMRVGIRIIQRNSDYVLVVGDVATGDQVVTEGLQSLRPGTELDIARRSAPPTARQAARES